MYSYLKTVTSISANELVFLLKSIVYHKKTKELGEFFINEVISVSFSNFKIIELVNTILEYNDLEMLKYLLKKLSLEDQHHVNSEFIEIYGYKIKKENIENYVKGTKFFNLGSTLDEFIIQGFISMGNKSNVQECIIKSRKVAEFLATNYNNCGFTFRFSIGCLMNNLSNKQVFGNIPIQWHTFGPITSIEKLNYFREQGYQLFDTCFEDSFNGDLNLLVEFYKYTNSIPSFQTLLNLATLGYFDMVQYILTTYPNTYALHELVTVLQHCLQQKEIIRTINTLSKAITNRRILKGRTSIPLNFENRKVFFSALNKIPNLIEELESSGKIDPFYYSSFNCGETTHAQYLNPQNLTIYIPKHLFKEVDSSIQKIVNKYRKNTNEYLEFIFSYDPLQKTNLDIHFKMFLFLIYHDVITTKSIKRLIIIAIRKNLPLIIDLVLMIGPFKKQGFKNLYSLSNISLSSYLNEVHYLIFFHTLEVLGMLHRQPISANFDYFNDNNTNHLSIIQYLVDINYQYYNEHSNQFSFVRNAKENKVIKYFTLPHPIKIYLKNVGLLGLNCLDSKDTNNDIIQIKDSNENRVNFDLKFEL
ncbi:hypothetical protein DICPUDRAFT_80176 [Dictyostelium purpureum]|uniref:Uncharacterized protein n=1 Tax=Dictyostelium purpureum TaxID=5786 RepID=F0ZPR0_DICPU|nr:uncharacterized protein DICPUDRAFT_80176 [Dictyostelium purpureum]EGC34069.1 hypothetical protein DICPUDRAFT_80176 [Dictyostelium purpureum]|eukprot:XP_003289399.1 hypothetical protein DICPUDRAFT_80176 [Dictyostelium purpureum]